MSYALPKERKELIEVRYAQLIKEYGDDMDTVQDIIEAYIRKLDSKTIENEPSMFSYVKNQYFKHIEVSKNKQVETVPLTEDISVNMIGIEYPDCDLVTVQIMIKLLELTEKEFKIIYLYFFENKNYAEIAKKYKVTTERIRQVAAKALRKLRHPSRARILLASEQYFELGLSDNIIFDTIDNFIKIYSFDKDFNKNIVAMDAYKISERITKIFGNSTTAKCFIKMYCSDRKLRMRHLSETNDTDVLSTSAQPLLLSSDTEYLEIIGELETAINNLKRYKYFPYGIYIDALLKGVYKIRDKMAENELFQLKCILLYIIRKISKFRVNMLVDNIRMIISILQDDLQVETEEVLFRNIPLNYIFEICDNMLKPKEVEEINDTFKLIGIENPGQLPVSTLFSGLFLKSNLVTYFGSFYYTLKDYVENYKTIIVAKDQIKIVRDAVVKYFDQLCASKVDYLKAEKERIRKEEKERKRQEEEERYRKWSESNKSGPKNNFGSFDEYTYHSSDVDKIVSGIKRGSAKLNTESVYNILYRLSLNYFIPKYTDFILLNSEYVKSIIDKMLERYKDGTFKSIKLNEIDPYMPPKTWTELYYMFRTEPVSSRIQNNLDLHYWIIIDLFVIIVDYIGL